MSIFGRMRERGAIYVATNYWKLITGHTMDRYESVLEWQTDSWHTTGRRLSGIHDSIRQYRGLPNWATYHTTL